ncbi:hypothetical protein GCM10023185_31340 [Hymenobacter saemangeumensis]|uniref:Uncharacterized protein n=1 Tax=Hymenobacter saemangeumensis TaxID=1084522 RepID=A0ABP8IM27_9BACT
MPTPNYQDMGMSSEMPPQLRELVEQQLTADLRHYGIDEPTVKFDWSQSCIEGHDAGHLDGRLENYSGIGIFDAANQWIAEGWMEFVQTDSFLLVYWEFLDLVQGSRLKPVKFKPGIPEHVWQQIPEELHSAFVPKRLLPPPAAQSPLMACRARMRASVRCQLLVVSC